MPGMARVEVLEKLEAVLSESMTAKKVADKGQYVLLHMKVPVLSYPLDVIIYTTEIVLLSSPQGLPEHEFNKAADQIAQAIGWATKSLTGARPISTLRAKSLLTYVESLNLANENERMVSVIICDTCNEIMLREQMIALGIQGPPLEDGVPDKIKKIKEKKGMVYKENDIVQIRELRNTIVHHGQIPDKLQAEKCLDVSKDFFNHS